MKGYEIWNVTSPSSCAVVPSRTALEQVGEQQEQRDAQDDLGHHEREEHDEIGRRGRPPRARSIPIANAVPSGTAISIGAPPDGGSGTSRFGARVVPDGVERVLVPPPEREALPGAAGPAGVEREDDRDHDREDRPREVAPRHRLQEQPRLAPRIASHPAVLRAGTVATRRSGASVVSLMPPRPSGGSIAGSRASGS